MGGGGQSISQNDPDALLRFITTLKELYEVKILCPNPTMVL